MKVKQNIFHMTRLVSRTVQSNSIATPLHHTSLPAVSLWGSPHTVALDMPSANLPRDDSEAEEDLLTLNARSESLSSGLLLWEVLGDVEGGLDCNVPVSQG